MELMIYVHTQAICWESKGGQCCLGEQVDSLESLCLLLMLQMLQMSDGALWMVALLLFSYWNSLSLRIN